MMKQLMKKVITLCLCGTMLVMTAGAKEVKRPNSYNYQRGIEALGSADYDQALTYLNKEVAENPKNGYAWVALACIYGNREELGEALTTSDRAVKYIPKDDKEYYSFALSTRCQVHAQLGDTAQSLNDLALAIKNDADNEDLYLSRAQLYYELNDYDLSDQDYRKVSEISPGNTLAWLGLGRNQMERGQYRQAMETFNRSVKLDGENSQVYTYRAECYMKMHEYGKAAADLTKALSLDIYDYQAAIDMFELADSDYQTMDAQLRAQSLRDTDNTVWNYLRGTIAQNSKNYVQAIEIYKQIYEDEPSASTLAAISNCYSKQGDYGQALSYINKAIEMDSTETEYLATRGDLLYDMGRPHEGIKDYTLYIEQNKDIHYGYYRRGFMRDNLHEVDDAIDDYSTAIALQPDYAYSYLGRADMHMLKGDTARAMADYRRVTELDTVPVEGSCAHYALLALDRTDEALDFMSRIIADDPDDAGRYYDAACLNARMGNVDSSLCYLRTAFEKGYRRFAHIDRDDDMDSLRDTEGFKLLMQEYRKENASDGSQGLAGEAADMQQEQNGAALATTVQEISFSRDPGNMCRVNCNINGLPLNFILDTGASDVSISSVEANFMLKNGYLSKDDILGKQYYQVANGELHEGTTIILRKVSFGNCELTNVKASIVKNQTAPLLLGQSVLNRLGKIEVDYKSHKIRITK